MNYIISTPIMRLSLLVTMLAFAHGAENVTHINGDGRMLGTVQNMCGAGWNDAVSCAQACPGVSIL